MTPTLNKRPHPLGASDRRRLFFNLGLVLIVLAGAWLRWDSLTNRDMWFDEIYSFMHSQESIANLLLATTPMPPLFFVLLKIVIGIFGASETTVRLIPFASSCVSIVLISWLGTRLFGKKTGMLAALVAAGSSFHMEMSHLARPYALLNMLSCASMLCFDFWLEKQDKKTTCSLIAIDSLLVLTHVWLWVFPIQMLWLFLKTPKRLRRNYFFGWLTHLLIPLGVMLAWFCTHSNEELYEFVHFGLRWIQAPDFEHFFTILSKTVVGDMGFQGTDAHLMTAFFGLLFLFALFDRKNRKKTLLMLVWYFMPIITMFIISVTFKPLFVLRYFVDMLIPFCLLSAQGLANAPTRILRAILIIATVVLLTMCARAWLYDKVPAMRESIAFVKQHVEPGETIFVYPVNNMLSFAFYGEQKPAVPPKPWYIKYNYIWRNNLAGLDTATYLKRFLLDRFEALQGTNSFWFVEFYDTGHDNQIKPLFDIIGDLGKVYYFGDYRCYHYKLKKQFHYKP